MSTHKYFDRICVVALVLSLLLTMVFVNGEALGIRAADTVMGYEDRLFDSSAVHTKWGHSGQGQYLSQHGILHELAALQLQAGV